MSKKPTLSGVFNFRDIGGLPTEDGSETVCGSVFRSDALDHLVPADLHILRTELGIRSVIDLRATVETRGRRPAWESGLDAQLSNLPLSDDWVSWGELDDESRRTLLARKYQSYLDAAGDKIITALTLIADNGPSYPTIVHCTVGKDRTGVLISILLSVLGVRREAIVADYLLTGPNMASIMERLSASPVFRQRIRTNPAEVYLAEEHTIKLFLETLDEQEGGPASWALSHGLSEESARRLRHNLTRTAGMACAP